MTATELPGEDPVQDRYRHGGGNRQQEALQDVPLGPGAESGWRRPPCESWRLSPWAGQLEDVGEHPASVQLSPP